MSKYIASIQERLINFMQVLAYVTFTANESNTKKYLSDDYIAVLEKPNLKILKLVIHQYLGSYRYFLSIMFLFKGLLEVFSGSSAFVKSMSSITPEAKGVVID